MNNREFLNDVRGVLCGNTPIHTTVEIDDHARLLLEKMDTTQKKTAEKAKSAKAVENAPLKENVFNYLAGETERKTATEIGAALGLSTAKVVALCRQMVGEGRLSMEDIKVPKKGKQKGYKVV